MCELDQLLAAPLSCARCIVLLYWLSFLFFLLTHEFELPWLACTCPSEGCFLLLRLYKAVNSMCQRCIGLRTTVHLELHSQMSVSE